MPKFTRKDVVTNSGNASVSAHVGATDHVEYFNTSEDYKHTFPVGSSTIVRYLTTDLGAYQKCYLCVVI